MIEAPRGTLIHHYKVDESGAIVWANLIVATGHNNLAINHSVSQVARHFIDGNQMKEGMLNRVSAVVRAYDPCLSCSTHADGTPALEIALKGPGERCWIASAEGPGGDGAFRDGVGGQFPSGRRSGRGSKD